MTRDEVLIELARALPDYSGDLTRVADKLHARLFGQTEAVEEYAPIDWSGPIEAVHEDGRVMANEVEECPDEYGDYLVRYRVGGDCGTRCFEPSGLPCFEEAAPGWRIRNVGSK